MSGTFDSPKRSLQEFLRGVQSGKLKLPDFRRGWVAARHGVPYVIINRGPTGHDDLPEVTLQFEGDVTELFPPLVHAALALMLPPLATLCFTTSACLYGLVFGTENRAIETFGPPLTAPCGCGSTSCRSPTKAE